MQRVKRTARQLGNLRELTETEATTAAQTARREVTGRVPLPHQRLYPKVSGQQQGRWPATRTLTWDSADRNLGAAPHVSTCVLLRPRRADRSGQPTRGQPLSGPRCSFAAEAAVEHHRLIGRAAACCVLVGPPLG